MLRRQIQIEDQALKPIAAKVFAGERLRFEEGVALYDSNDLLAIGHLANHVREKRHGNVTYFNVNRHINPTNVCGVKLAGVAAELQNVPLGDAQVLDQAPCRIGHAGQLHAAELGRKIGDGFLEIDMRPASTKKVENVVA